MTTGIFISYRRDDTRQAAGRLADDLGDALGAERIFRDIEKIELGVDFEQALNQALVNCEVMLVLIGRQWSAITDAQGRRRLEQPGDWIRTEIVTALRRGIRVVPVLIDGADLPQESELPEDLKPLVRRQALAVEDARWKSDMGRLAESLSRLGGAAPRPAAAPPTPVAAVAAPLASPAAASGTSPWKAGAIGAGVVVLLVILLVIWADSE
ncbi:MAG: toll/interleukin-1 receptor domain-containing protein [Piscinibacter sp.]